MGVVRRTTGAIKKTKVGKLRRGQFISTSGCGAIVDMAKESVIIAGTDLWTKQVAEDCLVYEENLQKYLQVDYFVSPSAKKENEEGQESYDLPAFRFPRWVFCSKCKRVAPLTSFSFKEHPECSRCRQPLVPSRFVAACEHGHLDDFPYVWWVHDSQGKEQCSRPDLTIDTKKGSSGLDSVLIRCKCGLSRTMGGSFGKEALKAHGCTGHLPWLGPNESESCTEVMRTMQRGATNLYFGITASALSIPPWSQKVQVELSHRWGNYRSLVTNKDLFIGVVTMHGLPGLLNCTAEEIHEQAMLKLNHHNSTEQKTLQKLYEDEYRAFVNAEPDDNGQFLVRETFVPNFLSPFVEQIVLADKLREVLALRGFTRVKPNYKESDPNSYRKLSRHNKNWLPGMELLGEGIFIKLNETKVRQWEKRIELRYEKMREGLKNSLVQKDNFSPRYVLLHSLSHLLIRQLILECGYSSSAIKERIYSSFPHEGMEMAGLLIYTASSDSEGSLGGLVRQGESDRFENTFLSMLESASWCSADPLCIHSEGQGLNSLNMAACHSCSLLPETSCEARNSFLDRAAIVGLLEDASVGFFEELLKGN